MLSIRNTCLYQNTGDVFIYKQVQNIDITLKILYIQRHKNSMKIISCFSPTADLVIFVLGETPINVFSQDSGVSEYTDLLMHIYLQYCLFISRNVVIF